MIGKIIEDIVGKLTDLYLKLKGVDMDNSNVMIVVIITLALILISVIGALVYLISSLDPDSMIIMMSILSVTYLIGLILK